MLEIFLEVFTPTNLFWMTIGSAVGAILGFLPGMSAGTGIAIFLPITFNMEPATGLITLAAIYTSASFGGNITAILFNTPGTSDSLFMTFDGYPMTVRGESARALGLCTISSFVGGMIGSLALLLIAPPLAQIAIKFGAIEMFLTTMLGISIIVSLSKENMLKGLISAMLGFFVALIGTDKFSGLPRFTFGSAELYEGMPILPVILGIFALSQMFLLIMSKTETITVQSEENEGNIGSILIPFKDIMSKTVNMVRSAIIGTIVGIIPAAGSTVACGISYDLAKKTDKHPETYGKGNENGLVAVSAANNAVVGGSLVPLLTLAIPGNGVSALFLGGLLIHGLVPGMDLFTTYKETTYTLLFGMILCQVFILIAGLLGGKYLTRLTSVPNSILIPVIGALIVLGGYSGRSLQFDLYLTLAFGIVGVLMFLTQVPLAPFILAFVLGPIAETQLRRALYLLRSDFSGVMFRPINLVLLGLNLAILIVPFWPEIKAFFGRKNAET